MAIPHPLPARDIRYTSRDFERVRRLLHERTGIALHTHKHEMVYSRLARRVRALGLGSFRRYLDMLERGATAEWDQFSGGLTTKLTSFFREPHHFEILSGAAREWAATRALRIWCAGCATGEEAYSIAMTLVETFGSWSPPARIIATDIDTLALRKAERGIYAIENAARLGEVRIRTFLRKAAADSALFEVRTELRRLITFQPMNLCGPRWPVNGPIHAIFCRNVLIYFERSTGRRVIERFHPLLRPDGRLFVGHADNLQHCADLLHPLGRTVYAPLGARAV